MIEPRIVKLIILLIVVAVALGFINTYTRFAANPIRVIINVVIVVATSIYVLNFFHLIGSR